MKAEIKYDLNQEVWFIENGKVVKDTVLKVKFEIEKSYEKIEYYFKDNVGVVSNGYYGSYYRIFKEEQVFATKEELINSL